MMLIGAIDVTGQPTRWSALLQAHESLVRRAFVLVGLAIIVATYWLTRKGIPSAPVTTSSRPTSTAIGAVANIRVLLRRVGIRGFDRAVHADGSTEVVAEDSQIMAPCEHSSTPSVGRNDPCL